MGKPGNVIDCTWVRYTENYMRLEKKEIENIAWLARLAIEDRAVAGYTKDLADILALVEQMQSVDTTAVEPLAHPLEIDTQLRPDEVGEEDRRDSFQEIAPVTEDGYYLVPKFIE